ncbi:MAG TPA: hypothetical protein VE690_20610 [Rhodopila sp.]|nr:hypothetical protein [Rhodopila sp.]
MPDPQTSPFCSEFHVVEKSVELVVRMRGAEQRVRIDVLHDLKQGGYHATTPAQKDVTWKAPVLAMHATAQIWTGWADFPWVQGETAEAALSSALSVLREHCDRD